jgi:hypothetical protein
VHAVISTSTLFWKPVIYETELIVLKKDYFDRAGGIDGLFVKEVVPKDNFLCDVSYSVSKPKNESDFSKNRIGILISNESTIKDFYAYGGDEPVIAGKYRELGSISMYTKTPYPFVIRDVTETYKPDLEFCQDNKCYITLTKVKEHVVMNDGTENTRYFENTKSSWWKIILCKILRSGTCV